MSLACDVFDHGRDPIDARVRPAGAAGGHNQGDVGQAGGCEQLAEVSSHGGGCRLGRPSTEVVRPRVGAATVQGDASGPKGDAAHDRLGREASSKHAHGKNDPNAAAGDAVVKLWLLGELGHVGSFQWGISDSSGAA